MAFDFYFAGSQCPETEQLIIDLNANVLQSYVADKSAISKWFERKKQGWKGKFIIDSGAFTAHRKNTELNIDKYIEWLNKNDEYIDYAIELDHIPGKWGHIKTPSDVIEGAINSWSNYLYMVEHCKNPTKILPVFHQGEDLKYLKQIVNFKINGEYVPYICISGNKELTNKQREDWYYKCYNVIKSSNNPNVKAHCLGSATLQNAVNFPFTSMDATSQIMTAANGSIFTDYGTILVSDKSISDKSHISHLPAEAIQHIEDYLHKYNITLEQVKSSYKYRALINVHYLYDKSLITTFSGRSFKINKLF